VSLLPFRSVHEVGVDAVQKGLPSPAGSRRNQGVLTSEAEFQGGSDELLNPGSLDPADALISAAEAIGADLVVVGNRRCGLGRVLRSVPSSLFATSICSGITL
jgi:hypothetical protein